jgi:hypothetical protein
MYPPLHVGMNGACELWTVEECNPKIKIPRKKKKKNKKRKKEKNKKRKKVVVVVTEKVFSHQPPHSHPE